jgi:hypothetical protein
VYYRDPDDEKVYCLDVEILAKDFRQNVYINPYTQKPFDKDFIRRYTVTYFDRENGQTYTFPFAKLYKRLKSGNIINPETGKVFEKSFIKAISKGTTWKESSALRSKQFKRLDRRLAMCRNPRNVADAPIESIVYYKDPDDGAIYCFTIQQLSDLIKQEGINPSTGKKFSKSFVKRFRKTFSSSLHDNGINQPEFREIYGDEVFKSIALPKKETEPVEEKMQSQKVSLIIPDLWELVSGGFSKSKKKFGMGDEETVEENEEVEKNDEETTTTDEETTTTEEETTDEETTTTEEETATEEETIEEAEENKKDEDKVEMSFAGKSCNNCKKSCNEECHKSMMMRENTVEPCQFCSLKCMEKFHFPSFKKKKHKKK